MTEHDVEGRRREGQRCRIAVVPRNGWPVVLLGHGARYTEHTLIHIGAHHVPCSAHHLGCQAGDHAGATGHLKHPLPALERSQRHELLIGGYERGDDIPFMHLRGCASHLPSRWFTHTRSFLYAERWASGAAESGSAADAVSRRLHAVVRRGVPRVVRPPPRPITLSCSSTRAYWITSSARKRSNGGMVRPSA